MAARRQCLAGGFASALGWPLWLLAGCAAPWPEAPAGPGSSSALARLQESAAAHGLAAWQQVQDLSVDLRRGNAQRPGPATGKLQLRWLPALGLLAWQDQGQAQPLQGWRRWASPSAAGLAAGRPSVQLWQAGQWITDPTLLRAAAEQADLLRLLLLGPIALAGTRQPVNWAEPATLDGRRCDQLTVDVPSTADGPSTADRPSPQDGLGVTRLALFIDRDQGLMRRLRVMSIAEQGQPGAAAATWDLPDPISLHGQQWPRLWQRVPAARLAGAATTWQLAGLDRNRGYQVADLESAPFGAAAAAPAAALP